jgi:hypothetical protein
MGALINRNDFGIYNQAMRPPERLKSSVNVAFGVSMFDPWPAKHWILNDMKDLPR